MKLRVVELLIITTLPAMVMAQKGLPSFGLVAATLVGGTLAAGSSNAFNMVIETDTDKLMARTSKRPLVLGTVSRTQATTFASAIGLISLAIFQIFTTPLATLLTALAIFYYVVIYTIILKPNTSQNIVWGGAAGCMPVLIGWAAVTGTLTWVPVAFFMVIFFWTPPHFWALAIKYKDDYSAAGIPMLKAIAGPILQIQFCPTGGITPVNYRDYLALKNVSCVGGSWLAPADRVRAGDFAAVTALAKEAVAGVS